MSDTLQSPAEDDLILTIATDPMIWTDTPAADTDAEVEAAPGDALTEPSPDTEGTDLLGETDTVPVTDMFIAIEPVIETLFPEAPIALPDDAVDGPVEDAVDNTAEERDSTVDLSLDDLVWLNDGGTGTPTDDLLDTWVTALAYQSLPTPVTLTGSAPVASIGRPATPSADGPPHGDTVGTSAWLASNAWLSASPSFGSGWGPVSAATAPSAAPTAPDLGGPADGGTNPATDLPAGGLDWVVEDGAVL